jgi:hypothetical protein
MDKQGPEEEIKQQDRDSSYPNSNFETNNKLGKARMYSPIRDN